MTKNCKKKSGKYEQQKFFFFITRIIRKIKLTESELTCKPVIKAGLRGF